jgi:PAS domain S-box-containing protein
MQEILDQIDLIQVDLIQGSSDAIVIVDLVGIVRYVNYAAEVLFNRQATALIGQDFGLPIVAGERTDVDILHHDGKTISAEMRTFTTSSTTKNGEVTYIVASLRDITDRKRTEEWLRYQNDRERLLGKIVLKIQRELNLEQILAVTVTEVRQLLQADRVAIYQFNPDWSGTFVVESVADQSLGILGNKVQAHCVTKALISKFYSGEISCINHVLEDSINECHRQMLIRSQTQASLVVPLVFGENLWGLLVIHQCYTPRQWQQFEIDSLQQIASHVAIAIQQAESFIYIQELNRNLERQVAERTSQLEMSLDQLQRSLKKEKELNELKSQFVAMASHEFRTPLATIQSASDLLCRYSDRMSEEKKRSQLDKIQQEIRNMTVLLEELLNIGEIEAGRLTIKPQAVQLEGFCKSILEANRFMAKEQHILEFQKHFEHEIYHIDPNLVRKILTNLISNAIKYSPEGGKVVLAVKTSSERPHTLLFQVSDQGLGIPKDDRRHIFEPFFRARNVDKASGNGLGLAIVKTSAEMHGGTIDLESADNQGSIFTFSLPVPL